MAATSIYNAIDFCEPRQAYYVIPRVSTKRTDPHGKRLPISEFAVELTRDQLLDALSVPEHTLVEYMNTENCITKLYFDTERYFDQQPSAHDVDMYLQEIKDAMDGAIEIIRPYAPLASYVLASRHGFVSDKGKHKLSFRAFVSGVTVLHHSAIPQMMCPLFGDAWKDLWDDTVYKADDQCLAAINGIKTQNDRRVLVPLDNPDGDAASLLSYVAQHYEPSWPTLDFPTDDSDSKIDVENEGGTGDTPTSASPNVLSLVDLLGRNTADSRACWINVAIILKMLGKGSDVYFDSFVKFSRKSPKFVSRDDCKRTWRSLRYIDPQAQAGKSKLMLTTRTLLKYAREDDPEGFERWQKQQANTPDFVPSSKQICVAAALSAPRAQQRGLPHNCG